MSSKARKNWSLAEDEEVKRLYTIYNGKFNLIAQHCSSNKTAKQIRDRYVNHLAPHIDRSPLTTEEKVIILESAKKSHNWSKIAKELPNKNRTPLIIKNFYNNARRKNQHDLTNPMDLRYVIN